MPVIVSVEELTKKPVRYQNTTIRNSTRYFGIKVSILCLSDHTKDMASLADKCQYCNNLELGYARKLHYFKDWVLALSNSSCQTCRILIQAFRQLHPKLFSETLDGSSMDSNIYGDGLVRLWLLRDYCITFMYIGSVRKYVPKIQLYYPLGDYQFIPPIPRIPVLPDISSFPGDAKTWKFLRKCLDTCRATHTKCGEMQNPEWYPKRLLYIAQNSYGQDILQLIQTEHRPPISRYITLSHCWGLGVPIKTTTRNISTFLQAITIQELPRTFQDCITTAQQLGVSYVWIDSLCIIQDDLDDWAQHAQLMDKIYENALFTVAAVESPNSKIPFLGPDAPMDRDLIRGFDIEMDTVDVKSGLTSIDSGLPTLKVRLYSSNLRNPSHFEGPLESRGWTFQERYLSVRIINFTLDQVRWHCKTSKACEYLGAVESAENPEAFCDGSSDGIEAIEEDRLLYEWECVVRGYSSRELTYSTDRLPALAGIASRFSLKLHSEYLAGIWVVDFPCSFGWYRVESVYPDHHSKNSLDTVPSWSWASILTRVDQNISSTYRREVLKSTVAELIGYSCKPTTSNKFGNVEKGSYLQLRGKLVEAEMYSDKHGCAYVYRQGSARRFNLDCHILPSSKILNETTHENKSLRRAVGTDSTVNDRIKGQVYCFLLGFWDGNGENSACILVLGKQSEGVYQRLGISDHYMRIYHSCFEKDYEQWKQGELPMENSYEPWILENWEKWTCDRLGYWENCEEWFSDAETCEFKLV